MKTFITIFSFLILINEINSKCDYSDIFPFYPYKRGKYESIKELSPLKISYDFSTLESQKSKLKISEKYYNTIKKLLLLSSENFSFLLTNSKKKIIPKENICGENITNINLKEIETDILIYPYFDNEEKNIKSGICEIDSKFYYPLIGILKISTKINFKYLNSENNFMINLSHQLIHILGFNKIGFTLLKNSFEKKGKNEYEITNKNIVSNLYFINGNTLKNVPLDKKKIYHYDFKKTKLNDIMSNKLYLKNTLITRFTISMLLETKWYKYNYNSCNLIYFLNNKICFFIDDICFSPQGGLSQISYYFNKENKLKCYFDNAKFNNNGKCYIDDNIYLEYKHKLAIKNGDVEKCKNEFYDMEKFLNDYPEIKNITYQKLILLTPNKEICKCNQRTVFVNYTKDSLEKQNTNNLNLSEVKIYNKEYFVLSNQLDHIGYKALRDTCEIANMYRVKTAKSTNFIYNVWADKKNDFFKFQKYFTFLRFEQISSKDNLYKNYLILHKKFPNDYNYLPETYIFPKDKKEFYEKMKDYQLDLNNLWLIKPKNEDQGRGIKIMKNIKEICDNCIVTKYISNPHLLYNRKYDLRLYVLISSINPLIIYVFDDGLVRITTEDYNLNINSLDDNFIHLTNTCLNDKSEKYKINNDPNAEYGNTWTVKTLIKHLEKEGYNWDNIFNKIKDFLVKQFITMEKYEREEQKKRFFYNNNLFGFFGVDVLLDNHLNPWLIECNAFPSIVSYTNVDTVIKSKFMTDLENILGIIPFNHINGKTLDKECYFDNYIHEIVERSLCEFTRPRGGFHLAFPKKSNVDYYQKFFDEISEENLLLWNRLKEFDRDI